MTLISVLKVVEEAICDKGQRASCRESGGGDGRQDMRCVWERRGGPLASDAKRPPLNPPWTRGSVSPVVVKRRCLRIASSPTAAAAGRQ